MVRLQEEFTTCRQTQKEEAQVWVIQGDGGCGQAPASVVEVAALAEDAMRCFRASSAAARASARERCLKSSRNVLLTTQLSASSWPLSAPCALDSACAQVQFEHIKKQVTFLLPAGARPEEL